MVKRYKGCLGITIFKWNRFVAELWIIPPFFKIEEHLHPNQNIKIMYLWGKATFFRNNHSIDEYKSFDVSWRTMFRKFVVMHYHSHYFYNYKSRLIFVNFESWFCKPTSACEDIKFITNLNYAIK